MEYTTTQRELYIHARGFILKALDILDRAYRVGKYKPSQPVTVTPSDSIATAAVMPPETGEAKDDKLPTV